MRITFAPFNALKMSTLVSLILTISSIVINVEVIENSFIFDLIENVVKIKDVYF